MILETERLILRKIKIKDKDDLVEGLNNINISKYLSKIPFPYTEKDALDYIKKNYRKKAFNNFSIILKANNKLIGGIGIHHINKDLVATTGSWINSKYQRKGYVSEAKLVLNDYAFNFLKLRKLRSEVFPDNKASWITQEKIGYKFEGLLRKEVMCSADKKIKDLRVYGLLKEEWKKARPKVVKKVKEKIKLFP